MYFLLEVVGLAITFMSMIYFELIFVHVKGPTLFSTYGYPIATIH